MNMRLASAAFILALTTTGASVEAAVPARPVFRPGQWTIDVKTVATEAHFNTYRVCLKTDGTWYSTIQAKGGGRWLQTGDAVLWRGNLAGGLSDAATLKVSTSTSMSGFLMQWSASSTDTTNTAIENVYATTTWSYVAAACEAPF